jgi:hypothetical protein
VGVAIICDGVAPGVKRENDVHPRFRRVRVVGPIQGHNVLIFCYGCGYFHRIGVPCRHIFHMKQYMCLVDCDIRWYKSYTDHFGRIPRYTLKISKITNRLKEDGVQFVASPPTINSPIYTNFSQRLTEM